MNASKIKIQCNHSKNVVLGSYLIEVLLSLQKYVFQLSRYLVESTNLLNTFSYQALLKIIELSQGHRYDLKFWVLVLKGIQDRNSVA